MKFLATKSWEKCLPELASLVGLSPLEFSAQLRTTSTQTIEFLNQESIKSTG